MRTRLKVCCIQDPLEARLAVSHGADAIGLVASMPSGPGPISDDRIAEVSRIVPPPVASFLLTCRQHPQELVNHVRATGCNTVQICDGPESGAYAALRAECPGVRIVQVIHVQDELSLEEAAGCWGKVDALLLDSGRTRVAVLGGGPRELGGTARTHDWSLSARIVRDSPVPVFLAGGLTAANVADAVRTVRPFGVDLCNGLRTGGKLDATKLSAFVAALRSADDARCPANG